MHSIVITPEAERDVKAIYHYILSDSPAAATRWRKEIRAHIKTLSRLPERCGLAPESDTFDEPIRQLLYGKGSRGTYRILFASQ